MDEAASLKLAGLKLAGAHGRPVATADTRTLEVPGMLEPLLEGGVRRGSTLVIGTGAGGVSFALALVAAATGEGAWAAAVGLPSLGLRAAAELGVGLERLALVPDPGERWAAVVAALLDGMDLLLLGLPVAVRSADARRLVARTRERGTVLVVLEQSGSRWPEGPDLRVSVAGARWEGLGCGHGYLRRRRLDVVVSGRRSATRERRATLWLPGEPAAWWPGEPAARWSGERAAPSPPDHRPAGEPPSAAGTARLPVTRVS
jgi:hypothetical protein